MTLRTTVLLKRCYNTVSELRVEVMKSTRDTAYDCAAETLLEYC